MIKINSIFYCAFQNSSFRNGLWFSFFSFLNSGVSFLIMMLMASFVQPDSFGKLSLFTTLVSLFSIFINLGTGVMVGINFFTSPRIVIRNYLNVSFIISCGVFVAYVAFLLVFREMLQEAMGLEVSFQFLAVAFCFLQFYNNTALEIWRLEEKVGRYGCYSFLSVVANLVLTVLFVVPMGLDWQGRVYAQFLTCLLFAVLSLYILVKKGYLKFVIPTKHYFVEALKFGLPLMPHSTSFFLRQGLDRYIINSFFLPSTVGFFSFSYNFANIIQTIGMAFNASYSVNIYKNLSTIDGNSLQCLRRNCRYLVRVYSVITLGVWGMATLFIPILFPRYNDCIVYLFPLCGGAMFQCFYLVYVNILLFYKRTKVLMYITFSCSLLHCVMSLLLTKYGVIYTAYISLFSNMLIFMGVYWYSQKVLRLCTVDIVES